MRGALRMLSFSHLARRTWVAIVAGSALVALGASIRSGQHGKTVGAVVAMAEQLPPAGTSKSRFFSPTSLWNKPLTADAPLARASAAMSANLAREIQANSLAGAPPTINTTAYSVPIYTAPFGAPTITVRLQSTSPAASLRAAFRQVPLPASAHPATGSDGHLLVSQPSTDRLWEFWRLSDGPQGWQAAWGGAMRRVASDPGVYGPWAWPGATRSWGASASSLSIAGGLITIEDFERGEIDHAIAIALPQVRAGVYAAPAQRTDGNSPNPLTLPEGTHLRLEPSLELRALHLPPVTLMIAEAAQRYGIVVRDRASHVALFAQDPTPTGLNPYTGPHGFFEGQTAGALLSSFPWGALEVLRLKLHRCSCRQRGG